MSDEIDKPPAEGEGEPERIIDASALEADAVDVLFEKRPRLVKARVVSQLEELDAAIASARDEAERMVADAKKQAESIRTEAKEQAVAEAHRECLELLGEAQAIHDRATDEAERDLVKMAFRLAERLVGTALEFEPELVGAMVDDVVRRARGRRRITVVAHTADAARLEEMTDKLSETAGGARVMVEASDDVSRGGCVLKTEAGEVDARLETRLAAIRQALMGGD